MWCVVVWFVAVWCNTGRTSLSQERAGTYPGISIVQGLTQGSASCRDLPRDQERAGTYPGIRSVQGLNQTSGACRDLPRDQERAGT